MPNAPTHYCLGGCGKRLPMGTTYCPECKKRMRAPDRRPSPGKRYGEDGYGRKWRDQRARKLRRNPLCEICEKEGRTTLATMVDHIIPVSEGGGMYDMDNLQSLCRLCHARKTAEDIKRAKSV